MMPPSVAVVRKFWRLPRHDRVLVLEAALWLSVASFAIAVLPFRHVGRLAGIPIRRREPPSQTRLTEVRRIRWAVVASARRVPWRAMCFQQGLAAQFMLRRRGVSSVLYYGVAPDKQNGLSAHVWVRAGDIEVIGGETATRFAPLVAFPPLQEVRGI
jgi:Transglutaminase-like superfamily